MRKGIIPLLMVSNGVFVIPDITHMPKPIGGVIIPISITLTTIMPNHSGPKPSSKANGKKMGIVIRIIAIVSINIPRIIYKRITMNMMAFGGRGRLLTNSDNAAGRVVRARKGMNM